MNDADKEIERIESQYGPFVATSDFMTGAKFDIEHIEPLTLSPEREAEIDMQLAQWMAAHSTHANDHPPATFPVLESYP